MLDICVPISCQLVELDPVIVFVYRNLKSIEQYRTDCVVIQKRCMPEGCDAAWCSVPSPEVCYFCITAQSGVCYSTYTTAICRRLQCFVY